ncbi:hypothetical protein FOA52_003492 [Chlamydomonas sp. UWO 241]|nr:hypothetical protein FOA52_003492 [Chlamydomonas sp. UWO 241]
MRTCRCTCRFQGGTLHPILAKVPSAGERGASTVSAASKQAGTRTRNAETMGGEVQGCTACFCRNADAELPIRVANRGGDQDISVFTGEDSVEYMDGGMLYSEYQEDLEPERRMRSSRLHLAPGMVKASLHRAILSRPGLAALLGPQHCASLVTSEDTAAEAAASKDWPGCGYDFGCFVGPGGEFKVGVVANLEVCVCVCVCVCFADLWNDITVIFVTIWNGMECPWLLAIPKNLKNHKPAFAERIDGLDASTFVTLGQWLGAHVSEFGSATVEAIRGAAANTA